MSLQGLIFGETIKIDNHHSGAAISIHDRGLHLHKRQNDKSKSRGRVEAKIPFDGSISFEECWGQYSGAMRKEIKKAFKNDRTRQGFIDSVWDVLVAMDTANSPNHTPAGQPYEISEALKSEIIEKLRSVVPYFGMRPEDLNGELLPSRGVRTHDVRASGKMILDYQKHDPRNRWDAYRHLYVKADVEDQSLIVSSARYMVEKPWEDNQEG